MDSEKLDASSSSQSDRDRLDSSVIRIDEIRRPKRKKPGAELRVFLSDGREIDVAMRVWKAAPFHVDDSLSESAIGQIIERSELIRVREHALSFLARKEESRFLLTQKLLQRGYSRQIINAVLDRLAADGLLSDERFAREWAQSRLRRRGEGQRALVAHLRERGVRAETARNAVDALASEEPQLLLDAAKRTLDRVSRSRSLERDQIRYILRDAGFTSETINEVLEQLD